MFASGSAGFADIIGDLLHDSFAKDGENVYIVR